MANESEDELKLKRFHLQNKRKVRYLCRLCAHALHLKQGVDSLIMLKMRCTCQVDTRAGHYGCRRVYVQIRIASRCTGACKNQKITLTLNSNALAGFTVKLVLEQQTACKNMKNEVLLDGVQCLVE